MIHELRRYVMGVTMAHQERDGQCADSHTLPGTGANTVVFRITTDDRQALAAALHARRDDGGREPHD